MGTLTGGDPGRSCHQRKPSSGFGDADVVRAASKQRLSPWYSEVDALKAYGIIVHLPHVTAASLDPAALAAAPSDVQKILGR
ncbi:hypothetical protein ACFROC_23490 [Nocardia tengchongensis]|uniref:hypothetical protein n=1 Tax=Nocardia tengchongensis TaxID=2055889 RepID=UPI0036AEB8D9